jgi:urea transporter
MRATINKIMDGYGSFFALTHPLSRILICIAALLQLYSGVCGIIGALFVVAWRHVLQFKSDSERIEIINGLLLGMLIGSLFGINITSLVLIAGGTLLVVLLSALFTDTVGRSLKLPLLGLPYPLAAYLVLPLAAALQIPHVYPVVANFYIPHSEFIQPLGAMYFNGTGLGGLLVLLAFCLSSRYLALLAVGASIVASLFLWSVGVPSYSLISLVARMNSVLASCIIGGLFAIPGKRSLIVSLAASVTASALTISMNHLFSMASLPVLALPFVLVSYLTMLVFNAQRGMAWTYFWLSVPSLPEISLEKMQIASARGVDYRCIALKPPFKGTWQVYQGFGGQHTHKGNWHYALDFFQTESGYSFANQGEELSDYYCYGKPVLSPAYGYVVDMRGDLPDNQPGNVDTVNNWGNYVLIKLDCGSYVILCHLQQNSIKVLMGARIAPGDKIACVGNSGRSPQPHLHMHVQETTLLGSRTLPYHLTGVISKTIGGDLYQMRVVPAENEQLVAPTANHAIKRCLRLAVGNRFTYKVEYADGSVGMRKLEVMLDLNGQFWLESDYGAKVAFSMNDELLAMYNRQGPKDGFLDAFILAVGCTPLIEGCNSWNDLVPGRLLPRGWAAKFNHAILYPFNPCARSSLKREWDSLLKVWTQSAEHKIGYWKCKTDARICEAQGLIEFDLKKGHNIVIKAHLLRLGAREDNGIPEWTASLPQVS